MALGRFNLSPVLSLWTIFMKLVHTCSSCSWLHAQESPCCLCLSPIASQWSVAQSLGANYWHACSWLALQRMGNCIEWASILQCRLILRPCRSSMRSDWKIWSHRLTPTRGILGHEEGGPLFKLTLWSNDRNLYSRLCTPPPPPTHTHTQDTDIGLSALVWRPHYLTWWSPQVSVVQRSLKLRNPQLECYNRLNRTQRCFSSLLTPSFP